MFVLGIPKLTELLSTSTHTGASPHTHREPYAVVYAIGFGVAIDFVRPVIAVITTCAVIHYHQSLSPCNERAQTKVVHADRAKVYA